MSFFYTSAVINNVIIDFSSYFFVCFPIVILRKKFSFLRLGDFSLSEERKVFRQNESLCLSALHLLDKFVDSCDERAVRRSSPSKTYCNGSAGRCLSLGLR